jgi:hypothetical protein
MSVRRRNSSRYELIYNQAVKLDPDFLRCRIRGHKWGDDETVEVLDRNHKRISTECERCGSECWKDWTLRGSQVASGIRYPKEYCFDETGVLETADRNILREIYLQIVSA